MKAIWKKIDKPLFFLTTFYTIFGLIMILSASSVSAVLRYGVSTYYFFLRQLEFIGVAVVGGLIVIRFKTSSYKAIGPLYLLGTIALLFAVMLTGKIAGGAQSWLDLGFTSIQPTEFFKTAIILFMAVYYENGIKKNKSLSYNIFPFILVVIGCLLIIEQPDWGGACIAGGIFFFTFLKIPFGKEKMTRIFKVLGIGILVGGVAFLYSGSHILESASLSRLHFMNPCQRYTEDTGYQVCNGYIAYHNGGLFGVGLGNSSQKYLYLPEAHTDFIFAIIVEELGLIVGILVILGYLLILYRILRIGKESTVIRNQLICYGTFTYLLLHLLLNFMGSLALIPLTGVPIPFLSYGGSYNLNVIMMMFIVQRVAYENKVSKEKDVLNKMAYGK